MKFKWRRTLPFLSGMAALTAILALQGIAPDPFSRAQLLMFDSLQRASPWQPVKPLVRVVEIDDESLNRVGQWPWSRSKLAALTRSLQELGAKSIAFDAVFSEPDRTSPARLLAEWSQAVGGTATQIAAPDYDAAFAAAIARGRVVTGFGLTAAANDANPAIPASFATIGGDPSDTLQNFHGAVVNLPALAAAAAGDGTFTITAERDSTVRRLPLLAGLNGKIVPSLALEALRVAEDEDTIAVRAERNGASGPVTGYTLRVGEYEAPLDRAGALVLHHGSFGDENAIAAWRLLDPREVMRLRDEIRGHIVLVGASAVGLSDLRSTPLNPLEPGVRLHARALEQIMARHFLLRPAWASGAELVAAALAAVMVSALASGASLSAAVVALALCVFGLFAVSYVLFTALGLLFDPTLIAVAVATSGLSSIFLRYILVERDALQVRNAFAHYLSPSLVSALANDPSRLKLSGEQREMSFLFTDLEGFTSLTEAADPASIVSWLNGYLDGLCSIAMNHGGTVDKIVGDAMHVMFNAPLPQPDHAERAVRCALAIDAFAESYASEHRARGVAFGVTRIGVNTGVAVVGNFGGARRFDYTAHGDAINTAARLESANKALGTRICVARATTQAIRSIAFLPIGTLTLKGKLKGVEVFAPDPGYVWSAAYLEAFARMSAGDRSGHAALLALADSYPDQPILALHARRIRAGESGERMVA
jgi:adenylate cyclase